MVTKHTFHDIHQWPFFDDAAVFAVLHWVHTIHNLLDMRQLQVLHKVIVIGSPLWDSWTCGKREKIYWCNWQVFSVLEVEQSQRVSGIVQRHFLVQFSSVAQSCPTLCDPMNCSMPGLPVHHHLLEFTQTHVHQVGDAIQPSHPLSSPSPPAPNPSQHQSLFQWVNSSHEVAKVLEFQL